MTSNLDSGRKRSLEPDGSANQNRPLLRVEGLRKVFGRTVALDEINLEVNEGEFLTLLGPSGSGKTTLLRLLVGFERANAGRIFLRERDILRMSPAERGFGMVFQHYALFPHMTVADNIAYGLKLRGWGRRQRADRVEEMLQLLRLPDFGSRYPRELSGGQQQRVALGRALAYDPEVILMDEPLGALDRMLRLEMEAELRRIHREFNATIVYVTHDQQEALALSDRIAIMRSGRIEALGAPGDLYARPPNSFVASFFANANLLRIDDIDFVGDHRACVECAGGHGEFEVVGSSEGPFVLAVRRRLLQLNPSANALALRGTIAEALLFGDEREIVLQVENVGHVVALVDARESNELVLGERLTLFVPEGAGILVPSGAS